MKIKDTPIY